MLALLALLSEGAIARRRAVNFNRVKIASSSSNGDGLLGIFCGTSREPIYDKETITSDRKSSFHSSL